MSLTPCLAIDAQGRRRDDFEPARRNRSPTVLANPVLSGVGSVQRVLQRPHLATHQRSACRDTLGRLLVLRVLGEMIAIPRPPALHVIFRKRGEMRREVVQSFY